jgi:hypothetical protein
MATLATLQKELETFLVLFAKDTYRIYDKCAFMIEETPWGKAKQTQTDLFRYIITHIKVDGNEWSCGQFGSRWADTELNGKMCRLSFASRKYNPKSFEDIPDDRLYKIEVDCFQEEFTPKEAKRKQNAQDYIEKSKKAIKSAGNGHIVCVQEMRELMKNIVEGRRKSRGETVFFWHHQMNSAGWATNDEMREQAKIWKQQMKSGDKMEFLKENCQTKLINGEEWHILVCGHKDYGIDPLGSGIDDGVFMVSGLIYWFKHKASRDIIFDYLTK